MIVFTYDICYLLIATTNNEYIMIKTIRQILMKNSLYRYILDQIRTNTWFTEQCVYKFSIYVGIILYISGEVVDLDKNCYVSKSKLLVMIFCVVCRLWCKMSAIDSGTAEHITTPVEYWCIWYSHILLKPFTCSLYLVCTCYILSTIHYMFKERNIYRETLSNCAHWFYWMIPYTWRLWLA